MEIKPKKKPWKKAKKWVSALLSVQMTHWCFWRLVGGGGKETHQLGGGGWMEGWGRAVQLHKCIKKYFKSCLPPRLPFIFWPSSLKKSRQQFTFEGCSLSPPKKTVIKETKRKAGERRSCFNCTSYRPTSPPSFTSASLTLAPQLGFCCWSGARQAETGQQRLHKCPNVAGL